MFHICTVGEPLVTVSLLPTEISHIIPWWLRIFQLTNYINFRLISSAVKASTQPTQHQWLCANGNDFLVVAVLASKFERQKCNRKKRGVTFFRRRKNKSSRFCGRNIFACTIHYKLLYRMRWRAFYAQPQHRRMIVTLNIFHHFLCCCSFSYILFLFS